MISSCAHLALTRLAGSTFVGLIMCTAICFSVAHLISTKHIFGLCPSYNMKAIERHQLYEIWPYMGFIIICPCVYIPIYSSSNLSCSKVPLNIDVIMYGSFGPPFLSMKSISSSQCLTSVYEAWSCLGARTISLPFDTQLMTTMNVVFGNLGRVLSPFCSRARPNPSPVAGCLAFLFSSPPEFPLHISLITSPPTTGESTQHYRNYPAAARPRMSPKNLQPPSPRAGVHLETASSSSDPGSWTDASSPRTQPPILSSSC